MRVLVTGGAGYMGSVVSHELLSQGHQVCVLDTLRYGSNSILALKLNENFTFIHGDIRDQDISRKLPGAFEGVVHLAAIVGDPACAREPELAEETNLAGALRIHQLSQRWGAKRFIFASTCSNYGKMTSTETLATEESGLQPLSLYAETKVAVEKSLNDTETGDSPAVTILRFATLFGLSPLMRFDLTVNEFTMELATTGRLSVYGEQFWRPYVHVKDAAKAIALVLTSAPNKVRGQVFNVGNSGQNYQKGQIVDMIRSQGLGHTVIDYVRRDEDPRDYKVSFEKIEREIGFEITRTVTDGIREILEGIEQGILTDFSATQYRN